MVMKVLVRDAAYPRLNLPPPPPSALVSELQCCFSGVLFHVFLCLLSSRNVCLHEYKHALTLFKTYGGGY